MRCAGGRGAHAESRRRGDGGGLEPSGCRQIAELAGAAGGFHGKAGRAYDESRKFEFRGGVRKEMGLDASRPRDDAQLDTPLVALDDEGRVDREFARVRIEPRRSGMRRRPPGRARQGLQAVQPQGART